MVCVIAVALTAWQVIDDRSVFERFFGTSVGRVTVLGVLVVQATVPLLLASRVFRRKDF